MKILHATLLIAFTLSAKACAKDPASDAPKAQVSKSVAAPAAKGSTSQKPINLTGTIHFLGSKMIGSHGGVFRTWSGELRMGKSLESARIHLKIQVASVFSDPEARNAYSEKLDKHFIGEDFFHAEKFPIATFESTKIIAGAEGEATHTITGDLAIRGVTRAVTFPATLSLTDTEVKAKAQFTIDRTQWGIVYKGKADNLIRNGVVLKIDLVGKTDVPESK